MTSDEDSCLQLNKNSCSLVVAVFEALVFLNTAIVVLIISKNNILEHDKTGANVHRKSGTYFIKSKETLSIMVGTLAIVVWLYSNNI